MTHHNVNATGQEATVPAIKLTIAETKKWKNTATRPELELELLAAGNLPGALVRDHKSAVLGRLTGGAVSSLPHVPGGIQQPHQRAGAPTQVPQPAQRHAPPALPVAQASATPPAVQWTQHAPPVVAPPALAPVPLQPPGPIARRAAAAVAEELRQLRALDAEARAIGEALGVGGTGAEILAALRIRLVEQDKELAELEALTLALCDAENVVEKEHAAEKADAAAAAADVVIPIVEPALDGDG